MITQGPEGPAPVGDIVATVYKDSSREWTVCRTAATAVAELPAAGGRRSAARWRGSGTVWPTSRPSSKPTPSGFTRSPDLDRNWVLVVGHLATVTVRDHRTGDDPIEQTWFMVNKLYLTPFRGRVIERHSTQFFYATGTTSNAQVLAISRGEQSPRAAHITWTGMATYGGSSGPSSVEDMFVTGEADFTRSPLPIRADEYFVRQTR